MPSQRRTYSGHYSDAIGGSSWQVNYLDGIGYKEYLCSIRNFVYFLVILPSGTEQVNKQGFIEHVYLRTIISKNDVVGIGSEDVSGDDSWSSLPDFPGNVVKRVYLRKLGVRGHEFPGYGY